jgi:hypothetical protein
VHVSATRIFARLEGAEQWLVYSMELSAAGEVAMILPVPVRPGSGDEALRFTSLEGREAFFDVLESLFLVPPPASRSMGHQLMPQARARPLLKVHAVGAFEASYVPSPADFDRLDPRFRLPDAVWSELGDYRDYGFAVFRLRPGPKARIHPMAFRFLTRDPARLFLPTVHIHDGQVHAEARFDHALFYQAPEAAPSDETSPLRPGADKDGIVLEGQPVHRRRLEGNPPNRDTWIPAGPRLAEAS